MSQKLLDELGVDRLPIHMRDKSVTQLMALDGKIAVVTAGGGPSLGQAIVHRLAGLGASVVVLDRSPDAAKHVAAAAATRWKVETLSIGADITRWDDVSRAVAAIVERFGHIDIWVNNVGGIARVAPFAEMTCSEIDFDITLNLRGALYCTRQVLDLMLPRRR